MMGLVSIEGRQVTISDLAAYGRAGMQYGSLWAGICGSVSELRNTTSPALARQGYSVLRIRGVRLSAPVGHHHNIVLDFTEYAE